MRSRASLLDLVSEAYPAHATALLRPLLDLLTLGRAACDGDLDKLLILVAIAIRTTEHKDFQALTQAQLLSGEVPVFPSLGINIQSVADSIGAPKETVRRKVTDLVEHGWIDRQGGDLRFTAYGYRELTPVRQQVEAMSVDHFLLLAALLREAGEAGAA